MKKKLAIVGYGGQGGWHAAWAQKSDVVELAGIYDIREERMTAARNAGIHTYDSFEALLADESVSLVTVATPNDVHEELVCRALRAGKNVICEKPVALSVASLDRMEQVAKENGVLFTVHQNRRWDVDFLAMKKLIEEGRLGNVLRVESRIHGSRGIPSDWRCHRQYGGGMILDWGVHLIDQMLQLIPEEVKTVNCAVTHYTNQEVDDGFRLELTFNSGKTALVEVGTLNFIAMPRFYLQCESGTALLTDWREKPKAVKCSAWNERDVLPVQTAAGITKTMAPRDEITTETWEEEKPVSDVHDFYRNVVAAIDGKEPQLITYPQVRRVLRVMEASFESARVGQTIQVNI